MQINRNMITFNKILKNNIDDRIFSYLLNNVKTWKDFKTDVRKMIFSLGKDFKAINTFYVYFQNSYQFIVTFYALAVSNKICIIINEPSSISQILTIRNYCLLTDISSIQNKYQTQSCNTYLFQDCLSSIRETSNHRDLSFSNNKFFYICTSGSSGQPKLIKKYFYQVNHEILAIEKKWGEQAKQYDILSNVSHQHLYGLTFKIFWPMCTYRSFNEEIFMYPEDLVNRCAKKIIISSPATLSRLEGMPCLISPKLVFSSGGKLKEHDAMKSCKIFNKNITEIYGSTETGIIASRSINISTNWVFFPEINYVVDEQSCLNVSSPFTKDEQWINTQDIVSLLGQNQFILKGRLDRIIKLEEKRISLEQIENIYNIHELIQETTTIVIKNHVDKDIIAMLIVLSAKGKSFLKENTRRQFYIKLKQDILRKNILTALPKRYKIVDNLPYNSQGKLLKKSILQVFDKDIK